MTCLCEQHEQHVAVWSGRRSRVPPPSSGARRSPRTGSVVVTTGAKTDATIEATGETTGAIVASRQAIGCTTASPTAQTGR